jgi:hypothetical protein
MRKPCTVTRIMLLKFCRQYTPPPLTSFPRGSSGGGLLSRPLIFHKIRALFFCPNIHDLERPHKPMCGLCFGCTNLD